MRIFKNTWFRRFARDQKITDHALRDAVRRAESGQIDANLGGDVVKQRVARPGQVQGLLNCYFVPGGRKGDFCLWVSQK